MAPRSGSPTADGAGGGDTATPSATATRSEELQSQLDRVHKATERYTDPTAALKDGFKPGGPYVPGMGWHFTHPKRGRQAVKNGVDIEKPNVLTYLKTGDGLQLGAVEYGLPAEKLDGTPDVFADAGATKEQWHEHKAATHVFALPDDAQTNPKNVSFDDWTTNDHWAEFRPPNRDLQPGDTVSLNWGSASAKDGETTERVVDVVNTHPTLSTLHVWVHTENPDGVFAPMNPEFSDGGGHHGGDGGSHHDGETTDGHDH